MNDEFITAVENLIRKAPEGWLTSTCEALRGFPTTATIEFILQRLPTTNNADLSLLAGEVVRQASDKMSWEALSWTLYTAYTTFHRSQVEQHIELLWSGPSPAAQIPARRIDQVLYDLIANAKKEILLVTFAAARIERLTDELLKAIQRGVSVRLVLEFKQSSEGGLSYDAIKAFPPSLISTAEIYFWPVENRERNQAGFPGKLHAKLAIVDDTAIVSSANLTDDAFNRNLELGVKTMNQEFLHTAREHIDTLMSDGTFRLLKHAA